MARGLAVGAAHQAEASLITFDSRGVFAAAAPGLPIETFEAGLVAPGAVTSCNGSLSGAAASACFPAGGLLPGVVYSAVPGGSLVVVGAGFPPLGNTSKVLGPNVFTDTFNLTFASASAIGFDVFPGLLAGNVLVSIFSPADVGLGAFTIPAPLGAAFFGVISDSDLIGRITSAWTRNRCVSRIATTRRPPHAEQACKPIDRQGLWSRPAAAQFLAETQLTFHQDLNRSSRYWANGSSVTRSRISIAANRPISGPNVTPLCMTAT
jgi:hypothetical protein